MAKKETESGDNAPMSIAALMPQASRGGRGSRDPSEEKIKYYPLAESDDEKFWKVVLPHLKDWGISEMESSRFLRMRALACFVLQKIGTFPAPQNISTAEQFAKLQKEYKFLRVSGEGSLKDRTA